MDDINLWVIIAQIINFLVLFFIFKHFLWNKLVEVIQKRKKDLEKLSNIESDVKVRLEKADSEADKIIEKSRKKALEVEKSSEDLAKKTKEKLIGEAEVQAKSIISSANAEIEKERLSMMNSIKSKIVDLSLKLNEKLFSEEKVNKDFMEKTLGKV